MRENESKVDAISILLSRPAGWGSEALRQLRQALTQSPEHFTEANLQRAHERADHKALADIISMVRRAALKSSPLRTADERAEIAVARMMRDGDFTGDQLKWIDYIRQHLVANLSIDRGDFDNVPVLAQRGGWGRADRVFGGELTNFIDGLNQELVAA